MVRFLPVCKVLSLSLVSAKTSLPASAVLNFSFVSAETFLPICAVLILTLHSALFLSIIICLINDKCNLASSLGSIP
jgi:hypothetical protein